jgi:SAM-dependent methyltransferase
MDIFINKNRWKYFSEAQTNQYVDSVFNYYRATGFPFYPKGDKSILLELKKLLNFNLSEIYSKYEKTGIVNQTMHGLALCWAFMPHSFGVKCNDLLTPLELFNDDALFKRVIRKRIKIGDNMSDAGIRKMLRMFTGAQGVSNFRPTAAALIYKRWGCGGKVWDMSAGYGGRMLGAYKAGLKEYVGTDPCTATVKGLKEIKNYLPNAKIQIIRCCAENFLHEDYFDLCFTSPPYFNTEKYSDEDSQSYNKYPTRELWVSGFLEGVIQNCYRNLKNNGKMILNTANVKSFPDLEEKTVEVARKNGFNLIVTEKYALSHYGPKFKFEPIFVFGKR